LCSLSLRARAIDRCSFSIQLNKDPYKFHCLLFNDSLVVTKEHVESKRKSRRKSVLNPKPSISYQFIREIPLPRKDTKTKSYKDGPSKCVMCY
jgi:hypothetical protein